MKLTLNVGKVSLLALILAGGFSVTSFECVYGVKEEAFVAYAKKDDKAEGDFKKGDDKKGDVKKPKAEKSSENKRDFIKVFELTKGERKEKETKDFSDIKLIISEDKAGKVTRVKDELTGEELLKIDRKKNQIVTPDPVTYQYILSKNGEATGAVGPEVGTATIVVNDGEKLGLGSNFTRGKDGVWRSKVNLDDHLVTEILDSPRAKGGGIQVEMIGVTPEFLAQVGEDVRSPSFPEHYNAWALAYAQIDAKSPYIGVMGKLEDHLKGKEPGVYGGPEGFTVFKGTDGATSFFDSRKGVIVMGTEEARVLWSVMPARAAMVTLELRVDDLKWRQMLEGKYALKPIFLNGRAVYNFSQDPEAIKRIMAEEAFERPASWIFKINTAQEVELLRQQWAQQHHIDLTKMYPLNEQKDFGVFAPEDLAKWDLLRPDPDGWIKEGGVSAYKGDADGKGSFMYDREHRRVTLFDWVIIRDWVDRIDADPSQRKEYTVDLLIDRVKYPEFERKYLKDVEYFTTAGGKLSFQGLSVEKAHSMLTVLPFYKTLDYDLHREEFSDVPVIMVINNVIDPQRHFRGNPEEFLKWMGA